MQLTYRGVPYTNQSNQIQLSSSMQTGVYRGQIFNYTPSVEVLRSSLNALSYRGINYTRYAALNLTKSDCL